MSMKLTNTQRALLSAAFQRDDRCTAAPTGAKRGHAARAADQLIAMGLLKEIRAKAAAPLWRRDEETGLGYSLKLTAAGIKAIAVKAATSSADSPSGEQSVAAEPKDQPSDEPPTDAVPPAEAIVLREKPSHSAPRSGTKIADVISLLQRSNGATLAELVVATGWLPHTTRAALTGLRKRGYGLALDRADGQRGSAYRIVSAGGDKLALTLKPTSKVDATSLQADRSDPAIDRKRARRAA